MLCGQHCPDTKPHDAPRKENYAPISLANLAKWIYTTPTGTKGWFNNRNSMSVIHQTN